MCLNLERYLLGLGIDLILKDLKRKEIHKARWIEKWRWIWEELGVCEYDQNRSYET